MGGEPEVRAINHARAGMDVLAALRADPVVAAVPERPAVAAFAPAPVTPARRSEAKASRPAKAPKPAKDPRPARLAKAAKPVKAPRPVKAAKPLKSPKPAKVARAQTAPEVQPAPAPSAGAPRREAPVAPSNRNTRHDFRTRRGAQHLAGVLLLITVPVTAAIGWHAYDSRDPTYAGAALILAALTLGLWFLRVMTVPVSVSAVGPILEVRQGNRTLVWDLASNYSPVDHIRSRPGRSGWRVVLRNPDGSTFAIDGGMVPAKTFMELLRRYRPEL